MADHAATGAAQRRREGQLRARLRHERLTVAKALADATHHSAQPRVRDGVEGAQQDVPRQQKPPPPKDASRSPAGS